jgi:hypothetical protein
MGSSISTRCTIDLLLQKRRMPRKKSSASVTAAEIAREPRQPNRFEKKRNNLRGLDGHGRWAVIMRV